MKLNKQIIIPLISAVLIFLKEAFGYELPDGTADIITDFILWAITSSGIFINPKKRKFYDDDNMV